MAVAMIRIRTRSHIAVARTMTSTVAMIRVRTRSHVAVARTMTSTIPMMRVRTRSHATIVMTGMRVRTRSGSHMTVVVSVSLRTRTIEVVAISIAVVDAEVPSACRPVHGTIEVLCHLIAVVLPAVEHVAQTSIAERPAVSEDIVTVKSGDIVEIDFIHGLVLLVVQTELISHLVGQEQGLSLYLVV